MLVFVQVLFIHSQRGVQVLLLGWADSAPVAVGCSPILLSNSSPSFLMCSHLCDVCYSLFQDRRNCVSHRFIVFEVNKKATPKKKVKRRKSGRENDLFIGELFFRRKITAAFLLFSVEKRPVPKYNEKCPKRRYLREIEKLFQQQEE